MALLFETESGRFPEIMPKNNPGYDIISKNSDGEIERYIEVKGISDEWGITGVGLTKTEYKFASEKKAMYWLYVVEKAIDDKQLFKIQDPVHKITNYFFDKGWKVIDEDSDYSDLYDM